MRKYIADINVTTEKENRHWDTSFMSVKSCTFATLKEPKKLYNFKDGSKLMSERSLTHNQHQEVFRKFDEACLNIEIKTKQ